MKDFLIHLSFAPISFLHHKIVRLRRYLYLLKLKKSHDFDIPIISVGNLSMGGSGKTPFVIWLCQKLDKHSKKPLVLTRGYKGQLESTRGLLRAQEINFSDPEVFGDEAVLISKNIHSGVIVVGKKRAENLKYYYPKEACDVVILEDGFQHLKIRRDLDIVLLDATLEINRMKVFPKGFLREGMESLKAAKIVLLSKANLISDKSLKKLKQFVQPFLAKSCLMLEMSYKTVGVFDQSDSLYLNNDDINGKKFILVSGLGNPISFKKMVEELGGEVLDWVTYKDHHEFKRGEIKKCIELAEKNNAWVLTTEKDMVKIVKLIRDQRLLYLKMGVSLEEKDETTLINLVHKVIN